MVGTLLYFEAYELRKQGEAQGEAKGRAEGKVEGRAEGQAEGKLEGWLEGQLEMLKRLVKQGIVTEETAKAQETEIRKSAAAMAEPAKAYEVQ